MGDKDKPFSFEGFTLGIIDGDGFKELPIVENSLAVSNDDEPTDDTIHTAGSYSVDLSNVSIDKEEFNKFLGMDIQQGNDNVRSVYIQCGDDYINRPKNLKYPNKKRAKRIWNKWKNRFGVREAKYYVIPKATIKPRYEFKNGQLMRDVQITAEEISK